MPACAPGIFLKHEGTSLLNSLNKPGKRIMLPAVMGIAGFSGSGKTTLLAGLLPLLRAKGLRTAIIKNTRPDFEIDYPGKDSQVLRAAGAEQVLLASSGRWALLAEQRLPQERGLDYWLAQLPRGEQDLVLVEGFKSAAIPKLEIHRPALGKPLLCMGDPLILAVACSELLLDLPRNLPCLNLNDHAAILQWLLTHSGLTHHD